MPWKNNLTEIYKFNSSELGNNIMYSFDYINTFKENWFDWDMVIEKRTNFLPTHSYTCNNYMNGMTNLFNRGHRELKGGLKK